MEIEKIAEILIYYVHIPLGGVALLAGAIALIAQKGKNVHKKSGKVFYYSMLISAITAIIISSLPNHKSPFLFSIGLFSSYFLISGFRSLSYRKKGFDLTIDKILAWLIVLIGISMIAYPLILYRKLSIILTVFGAISLSFGIRDIIQLKDVKLLKKNWLRLHLGKMTGGYIAAVTAFFVVNQILPGIWSWFVPSILGTVYIVYWTRLISKKKK